MEEATILSELTAEEHMALDKSDLSCVAPFIIENVSQSAFSIAKKTGSIVFRDFKYKYFPKTDELIRADVLKWLKKRRAA